MGGCGRWDCANGSHAWLGATVGDRRGGYNAHHRRGVIISSPRTSVMPNPGASLMVISDSLKLTPPVTGLNWPSDGPSRSTLVMMSLLATARCTAAATEMLDSIMQPIMHGTP